MNRLERLEQAHGMHAVRVHLIELVGVDPRHGPIREADCFRDHSGSRWVRELGETAEQFRERVAAEAVERAGPFVALISAERIKEAP